MNFTGNIIVYEGSHDGSKQLAVIKEAIEDKPKLIYSNLRLFKTNRYRKLDYYKFAENPPKTSILLIDQGWLVFSYRSPTSKKIKYLTYLLSMARKLDLKVLITTTEFSYLDKRLRMLVEDRVLTELIPRTKKLLIRHFTLQPVKAYVNSYERKNSKFVRGYWRETNNLNWAETEREVVKRSSRYERYFNTKQIIRRPK